MINHPFLLHMVLTLTLMHDRFLTPLTTSTSTSPSTNKQSPTEAFHWYAATTLFNSILLHTHPPHHHPTAPTTTTPLHPSERDAIWACAILLGAISFSFIEARTPEQAWPLKPSSPADLDWLRISDGKREVWRMTEPERPDSVWRELGEVYRRHAEEEEEREEEGWIGVGVGGDGLQDVPEEVVEVYDLAMGYTASSSQSGTLTKPKNPYATAASVLLSLFTTPTTTPTTPSPSPTTPQNAKPPAIPKFITFITRLDPTYKHLLELKDPLALLLLAYWYAKVCECECARRWWVEARSRLECRAICMYLEKREGGGVDTRIDDDTMKRLLRWPRRVCEGFVS
ncbi:hypothetical protein FQN50_005200 [Emmonsiellopsis sp. PD_5]|nr:hypothetical protein FQN50_005200 [Emmonsiellopsis sp. PD_5]